MEPRRSAWQHRRQVMRGASRQRTEARPFLVRRLGAVDVSKSNCSAPDKCQPRCSVPSTRHPARCVRLGPPPLQVEYKMHAEEMMRRPGSDRVWELPSATPLVRRPLTNLGDETRSGFVETLGHRAREFPDANRLRPTHPASVVADRAQDAHVSPPMGASTPSAASAPTAAASPNCRARPHPPSTSSTTHSDERKAHVPERHRSDRPQRGPHR
jgi:hypothetical protein